MIVTRGQYGGVMRVRAMIDRGCGMKGFRVKFIGFWNHKVSIGGVVVFLVLIEIVLWIIWGIMRD